MRYAIDLTPDGETLLVTAPDLPEVTSFGEDVESALRHAVDALETAFIGRMALRLPIPLARKKGTHVVEVPALSAMKVELYRAMLAQNLRKADLARLLNWKPPQVDRLFDLRHASHLGQLEAAFQVLGKRLEIGVKNAA